MPSIRETGLQPDLPERSLPYNFPASGEDVQVEDGPLDHGRNDGPVEEKLSVSTPSSLSAPTHYSLTSTGVSSFRAVTFDWDRHSNPASGTSTFQPTPQMLPMTLPQIPTYAYFANYFRFDSLPVETRHKPD